MLDEVAAHEVQDDPARGEPVAHAHIGRPSLLPAANRERSRGRADHPTVGASRDDRPAARRTPTTRCSARSSGPGRRTTPSRRPTTDQTRPAPSSAGSPVSPGHPRTYSCPLGHEPAAGPGARSCSRSVPSRTSRERRLLSTICFEPMARAATALPDPSIISTKEPATPAAIRSARRPPSRAGGPSPRPPILRAARANKVRTTSGWTRRTSRRVGQSSTATHVDDGAQHDAAALDEHRCTKGQVSLVGAEQHLVVGPGDGVEDVAAAALDADDPDQQLAQSEQDPDPERRRHGRWRRPTPAGRDAAHRSGSRRRRRPTSRRTAVRARATGCAAAG